MFPMNFTKGPRRFRAIQTVLHIPLERAGLLRCEVKLNGQYCAGHNVNVQLAEKSIDEKSQEAVP
jgi:hypothetical protein